MPNRFRLIALTMPIAVGAVLLGGCSGSSGQSGSASPSASATVPAGSPTAGATAPVAPSAVASVTGSPSGSASPDPEDAVALGGDEVIAVISGMTHSGMSGKSEYSEYYSDKGKITGSMEGKSYTGTWRAEGDKACFTYPPDSEVCYTVAIDPQQPQKAIWTDPKGKQTVTTFTPGNAEGP